MNPFHAEIWDPGLLADKEKSNHTRQQSFKGNGESDMSAASSDDDDGHRKGGKPPSGQRKISFSGFKKRTPSPDLQQKKAVESKPTIWYRIFHHGEEEMSDTGSSSPTTHPKNYAWAKSKRVDSDDEYHSDDSHSSFSSLPPPSIELSKGPSGAGKKPLRSSPSLFHETANASDIESEDEKEAKPARSFVFNFWKSSPNIHPVASTSPASVVSASDVQSSKKNTQDLGEEVKGLDRKLSDVSLSEKYGTLRGVLGKGATATVRLCYPGKSKVKCAVKEFRKRKKEESKVGINIF